jgi:histidinol-phosphate phosphatase family protein
MKELIKKIDNSWSLFLDRDGVINVRPYNDYVKSWDEFTFLPGVTGALEILAPVFDRIFIVTNQQGIGKNLMTPRDLYVIHQKMLSEINANKGRIDAIYYCPDLYTKPNHCRKPGIRMARWAKRDYPEVHYRKSIMVGDTANDMRFGRKLGMKNVFVGDEPIEEDKKLYDFRFSGLAEFASAFVAND